MGIEAIITLLVILGAIILFVTERLSIDLIALLIIGSLVVSGVITPVEGIAGFSNPATLTVAFMFVISAAILKTGSLQYVAGQLTRTFRNHYQRGVILLMLMVSAVSAFINNTPVVAVMIPVTTQIAKNANRAASKLLIPVSYASIFGGTCTLIGTSTNILVSGIAEQNGLEPFDMFDFAPMGLCFVAVGSIFMIFIGQRLLPNREATSDDNLEQSLIDYLAELEILPDSDVANNTIIDSPLVKELDIEILELRRGNTIMNLPQGDTILKIGDILKVRCSVEKLKQAKDQLRVKVKPFTDESDTEYTEDRSSFVELVIPTNSELEGKTLRQFDFRRRYRASPLAIRHREEVLQDELQDVTLRSGDVILVEMKSYFLEQWKSNSRDQSNPFLILSEEGVLTFDKTRFGIVISVILGVILTASLGLLPIVISTLLGVCVLVITGCLNMKEVYRSIQWPIVFLLAGALSLGVAMQNSGLAAMIANGIVEHFQQWGPIAILSGIYLLTSLLTETMSNNATAALIAPLAIATAYELDVSPTPFLVATMFAASLSFMTPIGYQTNTMIYSAGGYRFRDFFKVGVWLNLLFWLMSTFLIPVFFPF
ncbi:MAG: SLC13 family permease [Flavobacteriales bacterium]|jgi:di/tricarboxylate transporter|nr:SLC13 family permease [Flavobacteriales bacterium]MBT4705485.1 SLC13 family permease [Flavobacteriales bacterium]MBT6132832.1 SLC13 family permease [Flavobacteriales bacterium]MBT6979906.1 SLC13 family permease [Flavobacteriales bacterium]MBT7687905.1 SLC13 family permease [Flavobacteriales bacterium]